jgi:hypothetical protein
MSVTPRDISSPRPIETGIYNGAFGITPLSGLCETEKNLADHVTGYLSTWFTAVREVPGRHWTGKAMRLDAVLSPLDQESWRGSDPVHIGLEFKRHRGDFIRASAQAVDYAQSAWEGFGTLPVFICPGIAECAQWWNASRSYAFACRFLGRFNVGELNYETQHGFTFRKSWSIVWAENPAPYWNGHCPNNAEIMQPKWGSR